MTEERRKLRLLTRRYNEALEIVKSIIGEEEVEILMEDKTVLLDISYYDEEWLGLCIDLDSAFEKMVNNNELIMIKD